MQERLSLIGGSHRFLNIFAAMKIGGFTEPSIIYQAIRDNEFEINRKLCPGDPEEEKAWIQIEAASYLRWLERRGRVDLDRLTACLGDLRRGNTETQIRIGQVQHYTTERLDRLERYIKSLRSEIGRLTELLIENRRTYPTVKSVRGRVRRRKKA